MPDTQPLPAELVETLRQQGGVEIVVGLPSYNNASTIGGVASAIVQGLAEGLPGKRAILVNTDCGSTDGTAAQLAALASVDGVRLVAVVLPTQDLDMPYHGIPGKGDGLRLTLRIARQAGARVCIMLRPDLSGVSPERIRVLGAPVLDQGIDFVAPIYARHRLD